MSMVLSIIVGAVIGLTGSGPKDFFMKWLIFVAGMIVGSL